MGTVEIYVKSKEHTLSRIGASYMVLDMFDKENIQINYKLRDSSDIAKVFSTYSQSFSIPASDNNTALLRHFFDSDVVDKTKKNYLEAKVYINRQLFKLGKINMLEARYEGNKCVSYNITFLTGGATLKELVGDTLISDIYHKPSQDKSYKNIPTTTLEWTRDNIYQMVNSAPFAGKIVPLISNKRVWSYDTGLPTDIKWVNGSTNLPKAIDARELRPAIRFNKIIYDIFEAYGIDIDCPMLNRQEVANLFIHCTGENLYSTSQKISVTKAFGSYGYIGISTKDWDVSANLNPTNTITISTVDPTTNQKGFFNVIIDMKDAYEPTKDLEVLFRFIDQRPGRVGNLLAEIPSVVEENKIVGKLPILKELYGGISTLNPLEFSVEMITSATASWTSVEFSLRVEDSPRTFIYQKRSLNNANLLQDYLVDLTKSLPEMKIIDFLSSFFKMFNVFVFQDDVNEILNLYTPQDFQGKEVFYELVDDKYSIKTQDAYNKYNFKHKDSEYFSNKAFKKAVGMEFGQLIYDTGVKENKGTYEVATEFSIVPQTFIKGTSVVTQYGFDSSNPTDDPVNPRGYGFNGLYNSVYGEVTLFYYNGLQNLVDESTNNISFGFRGDTTTKQLTKYPRVSIVSSFQEQFYVGSLGFQAEVNLYPSTFVYKRNLYSNYYANVIERLVDVNVKNYIYKTLLTPIEILNFKLIDTVIIGERAYSVEEASINITSGEATLTLKNK